MIHKQGVTMMTSSNGNMFDGISNSMNRPIAMAMTWDRKERLDMPKQHRCFALAEFRCDRSCRRDNINRCFSRFWNANDLSPVDRCQGTRVNTKSKIGNYLQTGCKALAHTRPDIMTILLQQPHKSHLIEDLPVPVWVIKGRPIRVVEV